MECRELVCIGDSYRVVVAMYVHVHVCYCQSLKSRAMPPPYLPPRHTPPPTSPSPAPPAHRLALSPALSGLLASEPALARVFADSPGLAAAVAANPLLEALVLGADPAESAAAAVMAAAASSSSSSSIEGAGGAGGAVATSPWEEASAGMGAGGGWGGGAAGAGGAGGPLRPFPAGLVSQPDLVRDGVCTGLKCGGGKGLLVLTPRHVTPIADCVSPPTHLTPSPPPPRAAPQVSLLAAPGGAFAGALVSCPALVPVLLGDSRFTSAVARTAGGALAGLLAEEPVLCRLLARDGR